MQNVPSAVDRARRRAARLVTPGRARYVEAVVRFKNWARGAARLTDEQYDRLNPPYVDTCVLGDMLIEIVIEDTDWLPVGYIPAPTTSAGWFFYHFIHGIVMRYPLWKVLLYALAESPPLEEDADEHGNKLHAQK